MGYHRRGYHRRGICQGYHRRGKINENIISTQKEIAPLKGAILTIMGTYALRG